MKAHHHFSDPEWDGEPLEPEPKESRPLSQPLPEPPSVREPTNAYGKQQKIKVKLADGAVFRPFGQHPDGEEAMRRGRTRAETAKIARTNITDNHRP